MNIPPDLKNRIKVPENPYDSLIYKNGYLFPTELKSTKEKSLPFKNIKQHQINNLIESNTYDQIIAGFLINFSELGLSFHLHIEDFLNYQSAAENDKKEYNGIKVNRSSITLDYCKVFGTEMKGVLKRKKHRWYVGELLDELIKVHG